jgi:hypothetical protein
MYNWLSSMQYTINPLAGFKMASRWMAVILGISAPLVVDLTSSMAELSGSAPLSLTATCAYKTEDNVIITNSSAIFLVIVFMVFVFYG